SLSFSPDGKRLAGLGNWVRVWDLATKQEALKIAHGGSGIANVVFSPDGKRLAVGDFNGVVKVWDATTGKEGLSPKGHRQSDPVWWVAFSPDGQRLASASGDTTIRVWNLANGQEIRTLQEHAAGVVRVAFSPEGQRLVSGSGDQKIIVWDLLSG